MPNTPSLPRLAATLTAITLASAIAGCYRLATPTAPGTRAAAMRGIASAGSRVVDPKVALGRKLFFEPRLSRTGRVACATCHVPSRGFSDGRPVSVGVEGRRGTRNAPTVLVAHKAPALFWDGRAASLEAQALGPIVNPVEMDADLTVVVRTLAADADYARRFQEVFGGAPSEARLAEAIATYERALEPGPSGYDRWNDGDDNAMSPAAVRGQGIFSRNHCGECHKGTDLTDHKFYNLGVGMDRPNPDPGRAAVTGDPADFGKFKTPTLRNIAESGPYFHDGSATTLEAVVEFYDQGGRPHANLDPRIRPLGLDAEQKADLVAFMRALSGGHNDAALAGRAR